MPTKGIGGHHQPIRGRTDDWITPKYLIDALGPFDLDPCACHLGQPWPCATRSFNSAGLLTPWKGRVWLNPPYGPETAKWLERLSQHGNGIAITFARTETEWFHAHVWNTATAVAFLKGRVTFHHPDGSRAKHNSGGPSCLIAYGEENANKLQIAACAEKINAVVAKMTHLNVPVNERA